MLSFFKTVFFGYKLQAASRKPQATSIDPYAMIHKPYANISRKPKITANLSMQLVA